MTSKEIAEEILAINGTWMVSQMGHDGLDDLIWDVFPAYQNMDGPSQEIVRENVGKELFG